MGFDFAELPVDPGVSVLAAVPDPARQWRLFLFAMGIITALEAIVAITGTVVAANLTDSALLISSPAFAFAGALLVTYMLGGLVYRHCSRAIPPVDTLMMPDANWPWDEAAQKV